MAEPITIPDLENGKIDIDTLADIVNLQEETTVTRLSGPVKTWYGVMQDLAVSGGLAYETLAELQAITGTQGQVAEVTNDGDNTGRYSWQDGAWVKSLDTTDAKIAAVITKMDVTPQTVPLNHDQDGKVAVWLTNGDLDARGASPGLKTKILHDVISQVGNGAIAPIAHDSEGKVPLWIDENGNLGAKGLSPSLIQTIVSDQPAPMVTDGKSLFKLRAKSSDPAKQIKIGFTGDSWSEYVAIPEAMRDLLAVDRTRTGEGWQSIGVGFKMNGITLTRSGAWSFVDGGTVDVSEHPTGIDGQSMYTTSATAGAIMSNIKCTDFNIYHHSSNGAFRYRVDGGAWVDVTSTAGFGAVKITGLADDVHTFELDTTGNTGTLYILGFYATSGLAGFEVSKMGNAAQRGNTMRSWIPNISPIAIDINLDVIIVILGTNDYRTAGATVDEYISAMSELVDQYKSATPDIGFVFVAPAQSDGVAVTPLAEYKDALYKFCAAGGYEFYNMYDSFGTYAQSNALGQWVDSLHLNQTGADNTVKTVNSKLLLI